MAFHTLDDYLDLIPPPNNMQPNMMALTAGIAQLYLDQQACAQQITTSFDIETAVGKQLDVLGDILGLSRILNFQPGGAFAGRQAIPILINYDTPNTDLTIDQVNGRMIYLLGIGLISASAFNLTFKSNATVLRTYQIGAYSGFRRPLQTIDPDIIVSTEEPGEALIMRCNVALPPFLVYVIEV